MRNYTLRGTVGAMDTRGFTVGRRTGEILKRRFRNEEVWKFCDPKAEK